MSDRRSNCGGGRKTGDSTSPVTSSLNGEPSKLEPGEEGKRFPGSMFWRSNFVEALNSPIVRRETLGVIARPDAEKCLHSGIAGCGEFAD